MPTARKHIILNGKAPDNDQLVPWQMMSNFSIKCHSGSCYVAVFLSFSSLSHSPPLPPQSCVLKMPISLKTCKNLVPWIKFYSSAKMNMKQPLRSQQRIAGLVVNVTNKCRCKHTPYSESETWGQSHTSRAPAHLQRCQSSCSIWLQPSVFQFSFPWVWIQHGGNGLRVVGFRKKET